MHCVAVPSSLTEEGLLRVKSRCTTWRGEGREWRKGNGGEGGTDFSHCFPDAYFIRTSLLSRETVGTPHRQAWELLKPAESVAD